MLRLSRKRILSLIGTSALLLASTAAGQSLSSGSIDGTVVSDRGQIVAGAMVTIVHERSGASRTEVSSNQGRFDFPALPAGEYLLFAEQIGFHPAVIRGLVVRSGARLQVDVTLSVLTGDAARPDTVIFAGSELAGRGPAVQMDVDVEGLRRQPNESSDLREVARLSSFSGPELELQGLPAGMTGVRIDGVGLSGLGSTSFLAQPLNGAAAFPLSMFDVVSVTLSNPDVEWGGVASGSVEGTLVRGGQDLEIASHATAGVQSRSAAPAAITKAGERLDVGLRVSGPIIRDAATFAAGLELSRRPMSPLAHAASASALEEARVTARGIYGIEVAEAPVQQALTGFGRIGWQLTGSTHVDLWSSIASTTSDGGEPLFQSARAQAPTYDGRDMVAGLTLSSPFTRRLSQEARITVESVSRTASASDLREAATASILSTGVQIGPDAGEPRMFERLTVRASETFHLSAGAHRLKFGFGGAFASSTMDHGRVSTAVFANTEDFVNARSYSVRATSAPPRARFDTPQFSAYAQDTWSSPSGLSILLGLRADIERIPVGEVRLNEDWFAVSGLRNTDVDEVSVRLSPRFGFSWDYQNRRQMVVSGSAGVYSAFADPLLLGEWIVGSRGTAVVRSFGSTSGWPDGPAGGGGAAPPLFLTARDVAGARTMRADLGFLRMVRAATSLHVRAHYRDTQHLPRMNDLNRGQPAWQDQFGRPVFGQLRQEGELLYVQPGTGRWHPAFDQVTAVDFGGWSTYAGLTTTLEHGAGTPLAVSVSYTVSRTQDNWIPGPQNRYPGGAEGTAWMEGRSDFDVPHRLTAAAEVAPAALRGARVALLYRYRSGDPFTPRFSQAVDVNADGRAGNEPAFIAAAIPGMDDLIREHDCLRNQIGRLVERNSCRTGGVHSLDASFAATVRRGAEVMVEAINILDSGRLVPDAAVYRIDPATPLNIAGGAVELPLLANAGFGKSRGVSVTGRSLKIGLRVSF